METVPIWDTPHAFPWMGRRVFSSGLLLPDIAIDPLDEPETRARLASRWGHLEVEQLSNEIAPADAMGNRTTSALIRIREFGRELHKAADERGVVPLGWEGELKWFLELVKRPDVFAWNRRRGDAPGLVRVAECRTLLERLAVEYDHLVTRRPRLSRCKLCNRVFVPLRPSRPESHCRANLWSLSSPPTIVERCVPLDDEVERNRTEKRLHQRYRRALARNGPRDADTRAALRAWSEWKRDNPRLRERGRQPRPEAIFQPTGEQDGNSA